MPSGAHQPAKGGVSDTPSISVTQLEQSSEQTRPVPPVKAQPVPPVRPEPPPLQLKKLKMRAQPGAQGLLMFNISIKGQTFKALIDSGANGLFISSRVASQLKLPTVVKDQPDPVRLADGSTLDSVSVTRLGFRLDGFRDVDTFHVLDLKEFDVVLGDPWLRRMNPSIDWKKRTMKVKHSGKTHILCAAGDEAGAQLHGLLLSALEVKRAVLRGEELFLVSLKQLEQEDGTPVEVTAPEERKFSPGWQEKVQGLLKKYEDVCPSDPDFKPGFPPARAVDHKIELKPGTEPPNRPMYRMSQPELEELRKQLEDLTERGYIVPSTSPFASPVLMVRKPGSTALRFCLDLRALNSATVKNAYPLPPINELLDRLHGAKIFSKIDLVGAYHQVRMDPNCAHMTAFRCRYGLFEFRVMPFGLCNAPATFQRLMQDVLRPHLDVFVICYLDDLIIWSDDEESHLEHVEKVLALLREHKLFARPSKCEFGRRKIKFLGHFVSEEGIEVDQEKIKAIQDWPTPKSVTDVLQFKGLAEFYRRFVKDFSAISAPLSALTGNVEWKWGPLEDKAFKQLKHALTHTPILAPPDYTKPFVVTCDASKFAVGAVLSQGEGKAMRVVAYESRKMIDAETRYDTHDKELLAVVHALKKWGFHLRGKKFVVVTDNWATKYIQTKPNLNHRQMNWLSTLSDYDFDIVHRPGKTNVVADALSRRPDLSVNALTWLKADDDLFKAVRTAAASDPEYQRTLAAVEKGSRTDFQLTEGLLWKGIRLYVPQCDVRHKLMFEAHDAPLSGHLGRDKTAERLSRAFYWPRQHHLVYEYCRTCPSCQAIKPSHQAKMGLLQPLPVPSQAGASWSTDLITGLPKTKRGHTAIVVFVDRMTKWIVIVPTTMEVTAEGLAVIFRDQVFRHFGMPTSIVSDRDPRFASDFWRALHKLFGTKLNMSTANHPETDGQTENANKTIEDMVRAYVSPYQDDWDEHLTSCEFAYNDSEHASHRFTPFYLVHGRHPRVPLTMALKPDWDVTSERPKAYAARLRAERERARDALKKAQDRQARYANKHRREYTFVVGDKVWLAASHLRLPRALTAKRKLLPRYYGPYPIVKVISDVAYQLELPAHFKIHPVIHISHLKANADGTLEFPHRPEYKAPPPPIMHGDLDGGDQEEYYSVESIRNHRRRGRGRKGPLSYLIKWVGYDESENMWRTEARLRADMEDSLVDELIADYVQRTGAQL